MDFQELFSSFRQVKAAVLGDFMLDTYWFGSTTRISPEAPVPVVEVSENEYKIGGAGNVALNLSRLGVQVSVFGMTGNDADAQILLQLLEKEDINTVGMHMSEERVTTNKIRIISRYQHLLRLDRENTHYLKPEEESIFIEELLNSWKKIQPDLVIFEDYNKGFLSPALIEAITFFCTKNHIPLAVDPKRRHFFAYEGCTIFKPNWKEVTEALNIPDAAVEMTTLIRFHHQLQAKLRHSISLITLGDKGIFCGQGDETRIYPAHLRQIADVSGAGDTVVAVAGLVYAVSGDAWLAAEMANIAGGLVCEEVGTVPLNAERFKQECMELL